MGQLHYLSSFAELRVADLDAAVRWYADVLGFRQIATYDLADGPAAHLRRSEGQDLVLREGRGETLHLATDIDLAELSAAARRAGSERAYTPAGGPDEPEALVIRDPDGHTLRVFARQAPGPTAPP